MKQGGYTLRQYLILDSVADDSELFFYPFEAANLFLDEPSSGDVVALDLLILVRDGLVTCTHIHEGVRNELSAKAVSPHEFAPYSGYSCVTFEQHLDRFDYGPHEFSITATGKEVLKSWTPPDGLFPP